MPRFKLLAPGAWGEKNAAEYSYFASDGDRWSRELSGQGGWRPDTLEFPAGVSIETEIQQAFDNVAFMLKAVGLDWSNVAHVNSDHVPEADGAILAATAEIARQFRKSMPNHKPIWTCLGVAALGDPRMRVEVR